MRDLYHTVVLAAVIVLVPTAGLACRCVQQSPHALIRGADGIVVARVLARDDRNPRYRAYRVQVERRWKRAPGGMAIIRSPRTDCMAELRSGDRYLLHLFDVEGAMETERCAGNRPIADAGAELALLQRPLHEGLDAGAVAPSRR